MLVAMMLVGMIVGFQGRNLISADNIYEQLKKFQDTKTKVVQVVQETQKSLKAEEKQPHPRQGNYQPGDVAIDKMFYFGHK